MYSPKIREDLIPRIHKAAKEAGLAMTTWVNLVIEAALVRRRQIGGEEQTATGNQEPVNPYPPQGE